MREFHYLQNGFRDLYDDFRFVLNFRFRYLREQRTPCCGDVSRLKGVQGQGAGVEKTSFAWTRAEARDCLLDLPLDKILDDIDKNGLFA